MDSAIYVRISQEDKEALAAKAASFGMTVSQFVRICAQLNIDFASQDDRAAILIDSYALTVLSGQLRRMGTNVNQIAHALNTLNLLYKRMPSSPNKTRWHEEVEKIDKTIPQLQEQMDELKILVSGWTHRDVVSVVK